MILICFITFGQLATSFAEEECIYLPDAYKEEWCRFVKHIGQGKRKESEEENAIEEDAWGESCCDFGGQLAAHQSR